MNNSIPMQQNKCLQYLNSESSNQVYSKSLKSIKFKKMIQIHTEHLEANALNKGYNVVPKTKT